jgi:hypothetical protein
MGKDWLVMKEPRAERLVEELKTTVERLNKLDALLRKMEVSYSLHRSTRDTPWVLNDVVQRVEY